MKSLISTQSLQKGSPNEQGWRQVSIGESVKYVGDTPSTVTKSLINIVHISDTHICDAQSPARVEYLDRFADPHHPISTQLGSLVGTYRAHESLSTQVLESAIQSINRIQLAPVTKAKIDTVLITGDLTDNAQQNELAWVTALLTGGKVRPDSGSRGTWEGAGGSIFYSPFFWNPQGTPKGEVDDYPRSLYGFPVIPELLDSVREPFYASGLECNFLAVHGNHDALLQGTVVADERLRSAAVKGEKIFELDDLESFAALMKVTEVGPAEYPDPRKAKIIKVTPDQSRDFVTPLTWNQNFYQINERNGLAGELLGSPARYWRKDFDRVTVLALDTVNPNGGWQGSIDEKQFDWLSCQLEELRSKYVLITSHHPLQDIYNGFTFAERRVMGNEIENLLVKHPQVIAWLCGHTHRNRITYFGPDNMHGFWQIETASLIDWPQEGRIVEIFTDQFEQIWITSTMFNHDGSMLPDFSSIKLDEVNDLSGLSRILALNDWQRRSGAFAIELNEGDPEDRNRALVLPKRI